MLDSTHMGCIKQEYPQNIFGYYFFLYEQSGGSILFCIKFSVKCRALRARTNLNAPVTEPAPTQFSLNPLGKSPLSKMRSIGQALGCYSFVPITGYFEKFPSLGWGHKPLSVFLNWCCCLVFDEFRIVICVVTCLLDVEKKIDTLKDRCLQKANCRALLTTDDNKVVRI